MYIRKDNISFQRQEFLWSFNPSSLQLINLGFAFLSSSHTFLQKPGLHLLFKQMFKPRDWAAYPILSAQTVDPGGILREPQRKKFKSISNAFGQMSRDIICSPCNASFASWDSGWLARVAADVSKRVPPAFTVTDDPMQWLLFCSSRFLICECREFSSEAKCMHLKQLIALKTSEKKIL